MKDLSCKEQIRRLQREIRETERIRFYSEFLKILIEEKEDALIGLSSIVNRRRNETNAYLQNKKGIKTLFRNILGSGDQIEVSKQKLLNAILDFNDLNKEVDQLKFQVEVLNRKLRSVGAKEQLLDELYERRKQEIKLSNYQLVIKIVKYEHEINKYSEIVKETEEAIYQVDYLDHNIRKLVQTLQKISKWRKNAYFGDISSTPEIENYARISKKLAGKIHITIDRVQAEVRDVWRNRKLNFSEKFRDFDAFMHEFNAKLIYDWVVVEKIKTAIYSVQVIEENAKKLKHELEEYRTDAIQGLADIKEAYQTIMSS